MTRVERRRLYGGPVWKTLHLPRPRSSDVLVALAFVLLGQAVTWLRLDTEDAFAGSRSLNAVAVAAAMAPLAWRRATPVAAQGAGVLLACVPHTFVELDVTVLGTFLPLIVLTASVGYHAEPRIALLGAALGLAGLGLVSWSTPFLRTTASLGFNTFVLLAPWGAARGLREREERSRRLGAALARERAEREARTAEVVAEERTRIARELHDIVAHGVSVMVVQLGGARLRLRDDPAQATTSLLHAEEAGRQALSDLRQLVGVLRTHPDRWTGATADPRPGLGDLEALRDQLAAAGLRVDLDLRCTSSSLPPIVDVSAYRIVQEALTNTLKHSTARSATVSVACPPGELRLEVHDPGPARGGTDGGGHGIVGIRERVALFRGTAEIGSTDDGGWRVLVRLPHERGGTVEQRAVTAEGSIR